MKRTSVVAATISLIAAAATLAVAGVVPQSDPRAIEIAGATLDAMGGEDAWNNTRYISWKFMGNRLHVWDKWTGNHRMEQETRDGDALVLLFNIRTRDARIFRNGVEITDSEELAESRRGAFRAWNNDTYWMFMPYKMLDPGVTLKYLGERAMQDERMADVVQLTFEAVGDTPDNKYEVFVAKDTGLVEQWTHWSNATDPEPGFTRPWAGWQKFGDIMLATDHGNGLDWSIHVYDSLPETVFTDPAPAFQQ